VKLFNALYGSIETFEPEAQTVTVYVCGITPYDTTHVGHAFTYTIFDILIRYLEFQGHPVQYVQNVTDIDDDILRQAKKVDEDWQALGDRWTAHFIRDMQTLNVRPPDHFPRATDFISPIISTIQQLVEAGVAYESDGSVYFHVEAWPEYGKLSRIPREQMLSLANERGNIADDPKKRNPLDFVLWQARAPGEPAWDSPWGPGRPGWHIECSTMSSCLLGDTVDIHGGGADLIFPHHESEIAQSEGATGQEPFVRYWLHTAMVRHEGEKMSKSLGNLVMVRDLLKTWSPDGIRLYLASHHYRKPWSHSDQELEAAEQLAHRLRRAVTATRGTGTRLDPSGARAAFNAAMDDDLNTPAALATLERLAEETLQAADAGHNVSAAQEALRAMGRVFGLQLDSAGPEARVKTGWDQHLKRFADDQVPPITQIRRRDRAVEDEAWIRALLHRAPWGVLATTFGEQPFINSNLFVFDEAAHAIYLHTARVGRTRTNVERNGRICFSVSEMGRLLPADTALEFSVEYAGVVVFGHATIVTDEAEARHGLQLLLEKYAPHLRPGRDYRPITDDELARTTVYRIQIEGWSGKKKEAETDFPGAFSYGERAAGN
jgi:L-cysteine:1D-myo-inositol 2-amino-2-deoxy-alpha-D-glucopyranoside ligase